VKEKVFVGTTNGVEVAVGGTLVGVKVAIQGVAVGLKVKGVEEVGVEVGVKAGLRAEVGVDEGRTVAGPEVAVGLLADIGGVSGWAGNW
jgi:hypothetical protein